MEMYATLMTKNQKMSMTILILKVKIISPNFNNIKDEESHEELRQEEAYCKAHISRK